MALLHVKRIDVRPLSVPLLEPFAIATATMTATRAALVRVTADHGAFGLGEAACLHPVTDEDQSDVIAAIESIAAAVVGAPLESPAQIAQLVEPLERTPVARAGLEMALLDALARSRSVPLAALYTDHHAIRVHLVTDVTIPILERAEMMRLARKWYARGFTVFKLKVGKSLEDDVGALSDLKAEVPGASFRVDANGAYSAEDAISFFERARANNVRIECFEQPCARTDVAGMARVKKEIPVPIIADESVRSIADVDSLAKLDACDGINLKVMKLGGVGRAIAVGRRARELGLSLMIGGMVETRVGMTAGAHVAAALGGVEFVDLDTAFLLARDPFLGGYRADGPKMQIYGEGLGVFEGAALH